jgi:hypothetical protein
MDNSFFAYLQQLELMAFFSAYPLVYAIVNVLTGNSKKEIFLRLSYFLPYAYALVGTLYLGLQLKNLYPDYSIENMKLTLQQPFLTIWGLLSILFWVPAFARRPIFSLFHSFVFFFFLLRDLVKQLFTTAADKNILKNDMKLYTDSLLLNLGTLVLITLIFLLIARFKRQRGSTHI